MFGLATVKEKSSGSCQSDDLMALWRHAESYGDVEVDSPLWVPEKHRPCKYMVIVRAKNGDTTLECRGYGANIIQAMNNVVIECSRIGRLALGKGG
jgi:hypothetical protein